MATETHTPSAQVLIVDDEADHAEVMAEALRRLNHVCTIVHDLPAAQDELRHGQFDDPEGAANRILIDEDQ